MKPYTVSIDIDLPRERVIELFDSVDNLAKWQSGFHSFEHLEGESGQVGAKAKITFLNKGRPMELIETVTKRDLPDEFNGTYEWKGGFNTLDNRFVELAPNKTRWESTCAYKLSHPMLKVMAFLMPGMFKKQNQKFLDQFKAFCEDGKDCREA